MKLSGKEKFDSIYEEYYERVFVVALSYMKDRYLAEEIFQDTFLELYVKIDEVNRETAENWLLTVAKHKSLNLLKKMSLNEDKVGYFEENPELIISDSYGNIQQIEKDRDCTNLSEEIFEELHKENVKWYKAVVKVYCHGRPQREVAGEMGMDIGTFHAMLFRARSWIKRHYGKQYHELRDSNQ